MPRHTALLPTLLLVAVASGAHSARSQSWPTYHGPEHDRSIQGSLTAWGDAEPTELWRKDTQKGFSSFAIADGRAVTLVEENGQEVCLALDAGTGKELWRRPLGQSGYDGGGGAGAPGNKGGDGPRSTPTLAGGRVYVFDAQLAVHCLDAESGKPVWSRNLLEDHAGRNIRWQNAACPLVVGNSVFVAGGGENESLLALDRKTGKVQWRGMDEKITHATPIVAKLHGVDHIIYYTQSGLVAVAPKTGKELWRIAYPFRISSAASPVIHGDIVYVSAGYGVGAGAYRIVKTGKGFASELLWRKRNKLMNHWSTPLAKDGHLYGMFSFKKYGTGPLQCVELATGEVKWSEDGYGPGNVICVGEDLVALSDSGDLVLVAASPDAYEEKARAAVLGGKCWSSPAVVEGRVFVRSTTEAVCLDLRSKPD